MQTIPSGLLELLIEALRRFVGRGSKISAAYGVSTATMRSYRQHVPGAGTNACHVKNRLLCCADCRTFTEQDILRHLR